MKYYLAFILSIAIVAMILERPPVPRKIVLHEHKRVDPIISVTGTYYNPVAGQCDSRPLETADGSTIRRGVRWVALSRDLLERWGGTFQYGDTIYVHHGHSMIRGFWVVKDCMNARFKKRIDFLRWDDKFPGRTEGILICKNNFIHK